jgi:nitroimidazol reductase NimA-like FMN-containing flavoprotein (pyridoxamine 5'-phosphate oxidase superfamily)
MTAGTDSEPEDLLETLDAAACARLLPATDYGRLAVVRSGRPKIIVLNHLVDGGDLLFRTRHDALLAELTKGRAVHATFEVDSAFTPGRSGWSVIAAGLLTREADPKKVTAARERISAWAEGDRDVVLRLDVEELTGRRVGRL